MSTRSYLKEMPAIFKCLNITNSSDILAHLPESAAIAQYPAIALFLQRAWAIKPDFAVTVANACAIAEICAKLDGLPLAIALAAVRIKLLPAQALLQRFEHRLEVLTSGAQNLPMVVEVFLSMLDKRGQYV